MIDRFIAINVGTGDAFYARRGDFSALVDGGLAKGFDQVFATTTGCRGVDVLVCTHNDSDHTTGILSFLNSGLSAKECWLPAFWLEALAILLEDDHEVVLLELLTGSDTETESAPETPERRGEEISVERVERALEQKADLDPKFDGLSWPFQTPSLLNGLLWRIRTMGVAQANLLVHAERILEIAIAATRRQIPIRWFDPETRPAGSLTQTLNVVSAAEVRSIRRSNRNLPGVLRLTQVNRDSLVLYMPPAQSAPGVLFSADSDFHFSGLLPADRGMIVTAPHHGAADQENVAAYRRLSIDHADKIESFAWVRSDRAMKVGGARPCREYLAQGRRYCTRCRGAHPTGQDVVLEGNHGSWTPASKVVSCSCSTR